MGLANRNDEGGLVISPTKGAPASGARAIERAVKPGEIIAGRYRIEQEIGRGGMGAVYVATDLRLERLIAVKVLDSTVDTSPEARARFRREAIVASSVRHPNVIEVYDADVDGGIPWIAMELLEGESIDSLIDRVAPLPVEQALWIALEVLSALEEIHAGEIVHRDLKPGNLFLEYRRGGVRLKVLDFGIARSHVPEESPITQHGRTMGTPWYMPPEQLLGEELDGRVDLFALGVILFESLTNHWPWNAEQYEQLVAQVLSFEARRASTLRPDLPEALDDVVARACTRDRDERFESAAEMRAALLECGIVPKAPARLPVTRSYSIASLTSDPALDAADATAPLTGPVRGGTVPLGENTDDTPSARPARSLTPLLVAGAALGAALVVSGWVLLTPEEAPAAAPPVETPVSRVTPVAVEAAPPPHVWVRVEPPTGRARLGIHDDNAPRSVSGLRPARAVFAPSLPFEIHQTEVTWAALDAWLEAEGRELTRPTFVPDDPEERAQLPALGIPWTLARDYCESIGGALPTEAQWEYAARGPPLRPHAWGDDDLDLTGTRSFVGESGLMVQVMASPQDRTPGPEESAIYDMVGNAMEWTADQWQPDEGRMEQPWIEGDDRVFRVVRGLPLRASPPATLPDHSATYRTPLCAGDGCPESGFLENVGFRCARAAA